MNRNLVSHNTRNATGDRIRNLGANELVAGDVASALHRLHNRVVNGAGLRFRNATSDAVIDGLRNDFANALGNFVVDRANALFRNHTADVVGAGLRFRNNLATTFHDRLCTAFGNHTANVIGAGLRFGDALHDVVRADTSALLRNHTADVIRAGLRFRNDLTNSTHAGLCTAFGNHTANVIGAGTRFANGASDFAGNRFRGRARNHNRVGNFLHAGLRNPDFTSTSSRRALNRANLGTNGAARSARITAGDATIDDATGNRNTLILPATGLNRNLFRTGLRNHGRARHFALNVFEDDAANVIGASLLFDARNHDGVVDLLRDLRADDLIDGVSAGLLFGDRNHDRIRNFLLTLFANHTVDGVGASLLLGNRNHDRVVHLLRNLGPNRLIDGIGASFLLGNRNHNRVRNLLLAVFPNSAIAFPIDRLLAVFPDHAVHGIGNLARLTFRNILCKDALTRDRNALNLRSIASNLLVFADDLAAGLHNDVALRREFRRARTAAGVRTRAAVCRLRLFSTERHASRDSQERHPKNLLHFILQ